MVRILPEQEVIRRLQSRSNLLSMPYRQRIKEIQIALMEEPDLDPDNLQLIQRIDAALTRILPRVKNLTPLTDDDLSTLIGKSRATVQAYCSGRLPEVLSREACQNLTRLVESRRPEIDRLLADIRKVKDSNAP